MNQDIFNKEMRIADANAERTERSGVNWAVISLSLIALTIFITAMIFILAPNVFRGVFQNNAESPGTPTEQTR